MAVIGPRRFVTRDGRALAVRTLGGGDVDAKARYLGEDIGSHEWEVSEPDEVELDEERLRVKILERMEHPDRLSLGAFDGQRLVADLGFRGGERRRVAHHGDFGVGVLPGWRGVGVGRELILTMLDWAASHPRLEWIGLGVWASNAGAIGLYRAIGFREVHRRARYFRIGEGRYEDDVRMALWVKAGLAPEGMGTYAPRGRREAEAR